MPKLLIIDDEPSVRYSLAKNLGSESIQVITAESARQGIELVRAEHPDAVICDVRLPDMSGLVAYDQIREIDRRLPVIIITAYSTTDTAIEAMKRGAFEYLLKPLDLEELLDVVNRALELSRLTHVPTVFDEEPQSALISDRIVGRSVQMHEVYKAIGRVASQNVTVLILGESGTGKELVARAIYQHSKRSQGPFQPINCAAIPEPLLESELFGHERGAFTGAERRRVGKFEQASGGTIFLDEIGDMPASIQAKVLRLLQEQRFERVGGNETIQTDVRVIAATNQPLAKLAASGKFRQDLLYRLNGYTIELPPLRDRADDLPVLVEHFLKQASRDLGRNVQSFTPEVLQRLMQHRWPGNVRELQSTIKYAVVRAPGDVLTLDSLPEYLRRPETGEAISLPSDASANILTLIQNLIRRREPLIHHTVHNEVDRLLLEEALRECKGNQVEASELLGISRNTLRAKLKLVGLTVEKKLSTDS